MTLDPLLAEIRAAALTLNPRQSNAAAIHRLSQAFQGINNVASVVGFGEVSAFAGHVEDLLSQLRTGGIPVTDPLPCMIIASADQVGLLLNAAQDDRTSKSNESRRVNSSLQAALLETIFQMAEPTTPLLKKMPVKSEPSIQDAVFLPSSAGVYAH